MKLLLKDFCRDDRGAVATIIVLMLFVLLGFAALAIDMSYANSTRTELQVTASAGALAGVQQLVDKEGNVDDSDTYRFGAVEYVYRNMSGAGNGNIVEANCGTYDPNADPAVSGSSECTDVKKGNWDPDPRTFTAWDDASYDPLTMPLDAVRVRAHRSQANNNPLNLFLAPVVGLAQQDVNVSAVAWAEEDTDTYCMIALDPTDDKTLHVEGSAELSAHECSICVNSTSPDGLYLNGTPGVEITSDEGSEGGGSISVNSNDWEGHGNYTIDPPPTTAEPGTAECKDPRADDFPFEAYYKQTCTETEQLLLTDADKDADGVLRIAAGTYCGGIKVASTGPVEFEEGVIHIKDGTLDFVGNHDMSGSNITFVCDNCSLDFRGGQDINFSAGAFVDGEASPYLVYEKYPPDDPVGPPPYTAPSYPNEPHYFKGDADASYQGLIYTPFRDQEWYGNALASIDPPGCLALIGKKIKFSGTSDMNLDAGECGDLLDVISVTYRLVD